MPVKRLMFEGLPVREAKKPMVLHITEADKKKAKRGNARCCVAANAVKRSFHVPDVRIHRTRAVVLDPARRFWTRYEMPSNLTTEALIYDRGGDFKPRTVILGRIRPSKRSDVVQKKNAKNPTRESKGVRTVKKHKRHVMSAMTELRGSLQFDQA